MIGYTTVGTNDFDKAVAFYDALLGELGANQVMNDGRICVYTAQPGASMFAVCKPYDGEEATVGNGVMVALNVGSKEMAEKIYKKALELGGTDEGELGERGGGTLYGGYFRDLDGNKLFAYTMGG